MALGRYVAVVCLATALSSGTAAAADFGPQPGLSTPPIWTGIYLGLNGGYSFANDTTPQGFIGGGQIGYNYQMGHLVVGIEADLNYDTNLVSSATSSLSTAWVGSVRPRLGYASGPWLFYGTAGLAYANLGFSNLTSSNLDLRLGWVAGAGLEYAMGSNWSLRAEFLHTDLGTSQNSADHLTDNVIRLGVNFRF